MGAIGFDFTSVAIIHISPTILKITRWSTTAHEGTIKPTPAARV
jgi:hypothetical protein